MNLSFNKTHLYYYTVLFYAFGLDYLYIAIPSLNTILNSIVIGLILTALILYNLYLNHKISVKVAMLYGFAVIFLIISCSISNENAEYILENIISTNNIKNCLIIPLFFLTFKESKDASKILYKFSLFMLIYYFLIYYLYFVNADIEGNFYDSYGMYFGFVSCLFWVFVLQHAFRYKVTSDYIICIFMALMIISYGSRSVIIIMLSSVITFLFCYSDSQNLNRKVLISLLLLAIACICYLFFNQIIDFLIKILQNFSNLGRTLYFLKNSSKLSDLDGRDLIWSACVDEILENPFKIRGVGGAVQVILKRTGTGWYPHNIILEIVLQFGIIIGTFLLIELICSAIRTFCIKDQDEKYIILPFCIMSIITLMLSLTFWECLWFWTFMVLYLEFDSKDKYNINNERIHIVFSNKRILKW